MSTPAKLDGTIAASAAPSLRSPLHPRRDSEFAAALHEALNDPHETDESLTYHAARPQSRPGRPQGTFPGHAHDAVTDPPADDTADRLADRSTPDQGPYPNPVLADWRSGGESSALVPSTPVLALPTPGPVDDAPGRASDAAAARQDSVPHAAATDLLPTNADLRFAANAPNAAGLPSGAASASPVATAPQADVAVGVAASLAPQRPQSPAAADPAPIVQTVDPIGSQDETSPGHASATATERCVPEHPGSPADSTAPGPATAPTPPIPSMNQSLTAAGAGELRADRVGPLSGVDPRPSATEAIGSPPAPPSTSMDVPAGPSAGTQPAATPARPAATEGPAPAPNQRPLPGPPGPGRILLHVEQPEIGKVRVEVALRHRTLDIQFSTDHRQTTELIARHLDELRTNLRDGGFQPGLLDASTRDGNPTRPHDRGTAAMTTDPEAAIDQPVVGDGPARASTHAGALDIQV